MSNGKLDQVEQDTLAAYTKLYEAGEYEELCHAFCHEGFAAWQAPFGTWYGGICSHQFAGMSSRAALLKLVADCVAHDIKQEILGC